MSEADPRADQRRALAAQSRRAILELLRGSTDPWDAADIAAATGLHVTTARGHLDLLVQSGLASRAIEERHVRGRPRVLFTATAQREPDDGDGMLAMMLAGHLATRAGTSEAASAEAESAGRAWGHSLAARLSATDDGADPADTATRQVVAMFDQIGFAPQARQAKGGSVIDLHHCPFRQVAEQHPEIACSIHLGMLRGAIDELGAPISADRLERFVTPTLCRAHLSHTS